MQTSGTTQYNPAATHKAAATPEINTLLILALSEPEAFDCSGRFGTAPILGVSSRNPYTSPDPRLESGLPFPHF